MQEYGGNENGPNIRGAIESSPNKADMTKPPAFPTSGPGGSLAPGLKSKSDGNVSNDASTKYNSDY